MKVVTISLDPKVLDSNSATSYRNRLYGGIVDEYRVVVHYPKDTILELAGNVTIYGVGGSLKLIRFFRVGLLLRRLIKTGHCDVISCSDPYFFSALAYLLAQLYPVGYEAHILGIEKLSPLRKLFAKFFIKRADAVRVNSTRLRDRLADEFGVPWDDIGFVPIYVPTDNLGFKKAAAGTPDREKQDSLEVEFCNRYDKYFNFVFFGRLVEVKNVPMQLRAMKILKDSLPQARLHIVGDGPDREALKEMAHNLGVADRVIFHGRQEGLALGTFYRLCNCMLLTSFAEGWPMVVYEAMSAGLPIIMTDVGCAGEMIVNDKNGLVVPVNDHEALAAAMERLATKEDVRQRLVASATEHIKNYWTLDQILAGYKQSWQKACKNKL